MPSSLRGERYIGMWQADQRHGPGVVVTQAGVCYQGTFQGDKMAVSGSSFPGQSVAELKTRGVDGKGCSASPPVYPDFGPASLIFSSGQPCLLYTSARKNQGCHW